MVQDEDDPRRDQPPAVTLGAAQDAAPIDVLHLPAESARQLPPYLLAVDCGLHTGLALFAENRRLLWYRSHHLGDRAHLRRAAARVLGELPSLQKLVVEGGGTLAEIWARVAAQRGVAVRHVHAEQWRVALLHPREQRSGRQAKQVAGELARAIIAQSGASKPKALRHDTAEAILIGWWALTAHATPLP